MSIAEQNMKYLTDVRACGALLAVTRDLTRDGRPVIIEKLDVGLLARLAAEADAVLTREEPGWEHLVPPGGRRWVFDDGSALVEGYPVGIGVAAGVDCSCINEHRTDGTCEADVDGCPTCNESWETVANSPTEGCEACDARGPRGDDEDDDAWEQRR